MTRRPAFVFAALVAAALLAPSAALAKPCPKIAASVDAPEAVVDYNRDYPEGGVPAGGKLRFPGHFFDATADLVVKVRGNTYRIEEGSTFKFSCYGTSRADRKLKPTVDLLVGAVEVQTGGSRPGGVLTLEGLFDPRQDKTMTFSVERTLTSDRELTMEDRARWFGGLFTQRYGTSVAEARRSGPIVGVTPYVGARSGSCRYVHGARLRSTGVDGKGYMKGSSAFT